MMVMVMAMTRGGHTPPHRTAPDILNMSRKKSSPSDLYRIVCNKINQPINQSIKSKMAEQWIWSGSGVGAVDLEWIWSGQWIWSGSGVGSGPGAGMWHMVRGT